MFRFNFDPNLYQVTPTSPRKWKPKPGGGNVLVKDPYSHLTGKYVETVSGNVPDFDFLNFRLIWRFAGAEADSKGERTDRLISRLAVYTDTDTDSPKPQPFRELFASYMRYRSGKPWPDLTGRGLRDILRISVPEGTDDPFEDVEGFIDTEIGIQKYLFSQRRTERGDP